VSEGRFLAAGVEHFQHSANGWTRE
jgi:hypothetical protein